MAIVTGFFESISGRVGDIVYRKRGGKTIAAVRPSRRSSRKNAEEIKLETIFGLTGKIAKTINSIEIIKYFWHSKASKNQSIYNAIFKKNYGLLNVENLSGSVMITATPGFEAINPSIYPGETNLVIECKSLGDRNAFDMSLEKYVSAAGIVVLKDPTSENIPKYEVLAFKSKKYLLYPNDYLSFSLDFAGGELGIFERYSVKKVFAVFVTMDEDEMPVQHSLTFTNED